MMRGVVDSYVYVTAVEYGKYGHELGQGLAPPGWAVDVPWAGYTGAESSGLKNNQLTKIFIVMLQAAGINPASETKHTPLVSYIRRPTGWPQSFPMLTRGLCH